MRTDLSKSKPYRLHTCIARLLTLGVGCALYSVVTTTQAQQSPLTFNQVAEKVALYQQSNIWQQRQDIAQLHVKQQNTWQNPTLTIQQTGFKNGQEKELELSISQPVDVFSVQRKAANVATLGAEGVVLAEKSDQQQRSLALEYFWVQLQLLVQEVDVLQQQLHMSEQSVAVTKQRFDAGSIAKLDLERVEIQYLDLKANYLQQSQSLVVMKRQFSHLWGKDDVNYVLAPLGDIQTLSVSTDLSVQKDVNVSAMQLQSRQFEAQLDYLKAQAKPMPSVVLGVVRSQDASNQITDQQVRVGVEIPLAIFQRQQHSKEIERIKMALMDQSQRRYQQQKTLDQSTVAAEYEVLRTQYQLLTQQQIPLVQSMKDKTLLGFKAGKYTVTEVQLATASLQERQLQALQVKKLLWQKYFQHKAVLLGISPEQVLSLDAVSNLNRSIWRNTNNLPVVGGE